MDGQRITRSGILSLLTFLAAVSLVGAQESPKAGYWKGKLEIRQFNFSFAVGVRNKSYIVRRTDVWNTNYDFYQNPEGVAREDLTSINRNRSVGGPMDVKLMNYSDGKGLIFDKGHPRAIAGPLVPPTPGKSLGERRILGFSCRGEEYEWKTFQHATVQLRSWKAENSSLKVPLLEVEYFTDSAGALIGLTVQFIASVEPAANLPDSFFKPPVGLRITNVPSIR